ncbi:FtsX-like permease family protein [Streptomyces sp. NPDC085665]|uniref:FtsX-like permease family protein n=1 Tax=Streptomyces sp. NPDC085665 TaxID=3365735 RepID=UPI0037D1590F
MLALAARMLRFRMGGFIATFVALLFGALIVMGCGGLMETALRNNAPPSRLAQADVLVNGNRSYVVPHSGEDAETVVLPEQVPLPAGLADKVRAVPGVRDVVAERTLEAAVLRDGRPVGPAEGKAKAHGWESAALTPYGLASGAAPKGADEVVLDGALASAAGAKTGDQVQITASGGTATYRLSGIARPENRRTVDEPTLFFSSGQAERLARPAGAIATLGVIVAPGTDSGAVRDRIAKALDGQPVQIVTGDDRGAVEDPLVLTGKQKMIIMSAVFGGMATMVAVFIVSSTIGLAVQQRRREFALMRAIGATPGQLRRMLLGETLLVTVVSAAIAWVAGPVLSEALLGQLVEAGLVSGAVEFSMGWIPTLAASVAMLLTSVLGGWLGARRAVSAKPTEALAEAALQQKWLTKTRLGFALVFLGGTAALATVTMMVFDGTIAAATAGPGVIVAVIGLALISPGLTKVLLRWFAVPLRRFVGVDGQLALLNSEVRALRVAAVATPVMLAVGFATGNVYLQTTLVDASQRAFVENLRADAVLTAPAGGIDPELLNRVRDIKGVAGASLYTTSTGFVERPFDSSQDDGGLPLQGVSADGVAQTLTARTTDGNLAGLTGNSVALTEQKAKELRLGIGDALTLRMGDRSTLEVRLVAVFEGRDGYPMGLMPADTLAAHTTNGLPGQILVRAGEGGEHLTAALAAVAKTQPGVAVVDRDTLVEAHSTGMETMAWINYLLGGAIVAYAAISVINSLIMSTHNRRRELGLQRLSGATKAQVMRMAAVEAGLVSAIGVVLGTVAAATALIPFSIAAADSLMPSGPIWIYLAITSTVTAITVGATLAPTWAALKIRPIEAARAAD